MPLAAPALYRRAVFLAQQSHRATRKKEGTMFSSTQLIHRSLAALVLAAATAVLAAPAGASTTARSTRASACAQVVSENSCYVWSHRGSTASARVAGPCASVVSENSCYRWSHAGSTTAARVAGSCASVVSENSCYRWAHGGGAVVAQPLANGRTNTPTDVAPVRALSSAAAGQGFDWGAAGIGAAGGAGLMLLALGLATLGGRRVGVRAAS
jgi:hypothetical protein